MADTNHDGLLLAVKMAGSQTKLAQICGCTRAAINMAIKRGRGLSPNYVNVVESRLKIPRHVLRSDLYPLEREP